MTTVGIVAFVVALLVSVMLHEAGHFLTARHFGMKATQFFVGFGPTVWSFKRGETEYGVKAIPAGGYVKIIGMTPLEDVEPGDEGRAFFRHGPWQKFVVLVAGSTMHFVITLVLVLGVIATYGSPKEHAPTLGAISACVGDNPTPECGLMGAVAAPAKLAGLKAGDVVTAVDGTSVGNAKDFTSAIRSHAGKQVAVTVQRGKEKVTVDVVPEAVTRLDENGDTKRIGAIGVSVRANYINEHYGVVGTVKATGSAIGQLVTGTYNTFTKKLGTITKIYGPDRDREGFVGVYGAAKVSGEIAASPQSWQDKLAGFTLLIAGLNLFVGIFNLLPLLPLDGGHIAVVWFEAIRDRVKRARGYMGEVIRVDYNKLMPITLAVVVLFAGFTLWILGADIVNPIKLNQ